MIDHIRRDGTPTATTPAFEIVLSGDDFDADTAERYGWVNRTLDEDDLDSFVDTLGRRLASFDREGSPRRRPSSIGSGCRQQPRFSRASTCCSPIWPRRVRKRAGMRGATDRGSFRHLVLDFDL